MGSLAYYAYYRKEMLGWICGKMVILESALKGGRFSAFGSITARNGASAYNDPCTPSGDYSIATRNSS
jgi:hypothetical protein